MREGTVDKRYLALLAGRMAPKATPKVDAALEKNVLQGGERMVRVDRRQARAQRVPAGCSDARLAWSRY